MYQLTRKISLIFHIFSYTASTTPQRPLIAINDRPSTSASSTGIKIIENILVRPPTLNPNFDANVTGFDDMDVDFPQTESSAWDDGLNLISQANQMLNGM